MRATISPSLIPYSFQKDDQTSKFSGKKKNSLFPSLPPLPSLALLSSSSIDKSSALDKFSSGISLPHVHDVLCGRGVTTNRHKGNKKFRKLVDENKDEYVGSSKWRKMDIYKSIVTRIRNLGPPGRFLEKNVSDGLWYVVEDKKAYEKTAQTLRDRAASSRKHQSERNKQTKLNMNMASRSQEVPAPLIPTLLHDPIVTSVSFEPNASDMGGYMGGSFKEQFTFEPNESFMGGYMGGRFQ